MFCPNGLNLNLNLVFGVPVTIPLTGLDPETGVIKVRGGGVNLAFGTTVSAADITLLTATDIYFKPPAGSTDITVASFVASPVFNLTIGQEV